MTERIIVATVLAVLVLGSWGIVKAQQRRRAEMFAIQLTGGGNPRDGQNKMESYGCVTCHTVEGVAGADGLVGPPLTGVGQRMIIAGKLPNSPENLMRWIQHPRQIQPHTAMPEMGVTEQDSRDIAAYLYTISGGTQ